MTVRFEHETRIEARAKLVFDLSLDIYAHRALMAASNERATAGVTSGPIGLGETVTEAEPDRIVLRTSELLVRRGPFRLAELLR